MTSGLRSNVETEAELQIAGERSSQTESCSKHQNSKVVKRLLGQDQVEVQCG